MSLSKELYQRALRYADLVALKIQDRQITYNELNEQSLRVAAALIECGAQRETVGIVGQRRASSYFGIVGILYSGCQYTPINPKFSEARIMEILKDANIRFLVGSREEMEMISPIVDRVGTVRCVVIPEGRVLNKPDWFDETALQQITPLEQPITVDPEDLAYILYTSGSTGKPKGVQVTNSNILAFLGNMSSIYDLDPGFRASQVFDLSFDPSVSDMFFTWMRGGVLCVLPEEELMLPSEYIRREKITFWNSVPAIAGFMYKLGALLPGSFPSLRYSMFCGEQFPKRLADAWKNAAPNSTVENLYGPTEATIYISRYVYSHGEQNKDFRNSIIPIGRPFHNHEVALIDENGNRIPTGAVGEIVFKGDQITKGYLHDQEKTDSVFVSFEWDASGETWYRTGDFGFFDQDGNLECLGRRDNQVKLAGRRIELGEIEMALSHYPQTHDAVVVPFRDENQVVKGVVAFITGTLNKEEERSIRLDSTRYIEQVFFPKKIITIEKFPISVSGKIDRKALAELAQQADDTLASNL